MKMFVAIVVFSLIGFGKSSKCDGESVQDRMGAQQEKSSYEWRLTFDNLENIGIEKSIEMTIDQAKIVTDPSRVGGDVLLCQGTSTCLNATLDHTKPFAKCLIKPKEECPKGFTISFWVKFAKKNAKDFVQITHGRYADTVEVWYERGTNMWKAAVRYEGVANNELGFDAGNTNKWHQVGFVYQGYQHGDRLIAYYDGQRLADSLPVATTHFAPFHGKMSFLPGWGGHYRIDDVIGIHRSSTDDEMHDLYYNDYSTTRFREQKEWHAKGGL